LTPYSVVLERVNAVNVHVEQRVPTRVGILPQNADGDADGEANGDASGEILCGPDLEAYLRDNEDSGNVVMREAIRNGRVADWNAVETLLWVLWNLFHCCRLLSHLNNLGIQQAILFPEIATSEARQE
jgi:hypothetical protein